jgi:hypothetical protein
MGPPSIAGVAPLGAALPPLQLYLIAPELMLTDSGLLTSQSAPPNTSSPPACLPCLRRTMAVCPRIGCHRRLRPQMPFIVVFNPSALWAIDTNNAVWQVVRWVVWRSPIMRIYGYDVYVIVMYVMAAAVLLAVMGLVWLTMAMRKQEQSKWLRRMAAVLHVVYELIFMVFYVSEAGRVAGEWRAGRGGERASGGTADIHMWAAKSARGQAPRPYLHPNLRSACL